MPSFKTAFNSIDDDIEELSFENETSKNRLLRLELIE